MVYIEYEAESVGLTERIIHPYGLIRIAGKYLVVAFCELRDSVQGFNVENIRHVALTQHHYTAPKDNHAQWGQSMNLEVNRAK